MPGAAFGRKPRPRPPQTAVDGDSYLVPAESGAFAGHAGEIAHLSDGTWTFLRSRCGWRAYVADEDMLLVHDGAVVRSLPAALPTEGRMDRLGLGTGPDVNNRLSVRGQASLFSHGEYGGARVFINHADAGHTASLVFQSDFSGRAEFGLLGTEDFAVRASPDGQTFRTALTASSASGAVTFPNGANPGPHVANGETENGRAVVYGPPNLVTVSHQVALLALIAGRLYFSAFYVDRPTLFLGGAIALAKVAGAGGLIRAGLYHLGAANGSDWNVGPLIVDLGTRPADVAGHKAFVHETGTLLATGWYLSAVGVTGTGAQTRIAQWMTPGLL